MDIEKVIKWYGSAANLARSIKVSRQAVSLWRKSGRIPVASQHKIQEASGGRFKVAA